MNKDEIREWLNKFRPQIANQFQDPYTDWWHSEVAPEDVEKVCEYLSQFLDRESKLEKALKEIQDFLKWVEPAYKNAEIDKRMLVKYLNAIGGMTRKALGIDPTEATDE